MKSGLEKLEISTEIAPELKRLWDEHEAKPTVDTENSIRKLQALLEVAGFADSEIKATAHGLAYGARWQELKPLSDRQLTPVVTDLNKMKGGWTATVNGYPGWFMNRFGVVSRNSSCVLTDLLNRGKEKPQWTSLVFSNRSLQEAFGSAVKADGYECHYDGGMERVFNQRRTKAA